MAIRARIDGVAEMARVLDSAPAGMAKVVKTAMRSGANAVTRQIRNGVPSEWSELAKAKVGATRRGSIYAAAGLRNKKSTSKGEVPKWFKAYWKNYGTLTRRDPSHRFDNPIKPDRYSTAKRRRNSVGQRAHNFFEEAINGWEDTFTAAFEKSMKNQEKKIFGR